MNPFRSFAIAAFLAAALSACSSIPAPARTADGALTDAAGMTLYTFDNDAAGSGKSACSGACATNWPPLVAAAGAVPSGDYTIVTRDDGRKQWAYKGKPLYTFAQDKKPGDRAGDGFRNVWRIARP